MKLIKPSFEIWEQEPGLEGIYKAIEKASRVCYKSESNTTEDSAKKMVDRLIKAKHLAMLEHGTVYLRVKGNESISSKYQHNQYSRVKLKYSDDPNTPNIYDIPTHYITTNMRVLVENGWLDDLKYLCEPTEHHEKRYTVKFICDRAVSHQLVRSRSMSFAQESQRYCNYSKSKYGNEVTFIEPYDYNDWDVCDQIAFMDIMEQCEIKYLGLLKNLKPQQARVVLPNATKTEVVMTGYASDYKHFFDLRALGTTGAPHPDMKALAKPLMEEFISKNYIKSF